MDGKKIQEFRFYFKTDSVIMEYHQQFVCFNSFNIRNKRNLAKFEDRIRRSKSMSLNKAFGYAQENKVPSMSLTDGAIIKRNLNRVN